MIFLVQFGINAHLYIFFLRPQIALALWDRTILSLKKFTPAYLFQISLEIMWLTILNRWTETWNLFVKLTKFSSSK